MPTIQQARNSMSRAGRKRIPGKREPNGQLSRRLEDAAVRELERTKWKERDDRETVAPAVAARNRLFGVGLCDGIDPRAGSFVGRLTINGVLSAQQFHAAEMYAEEAAAFSRVRSGPKQPSAVSMDTTTRGSVAGYENPEHAQDVKATYEATRTAIQRCQDQLRGTATLFAALNLCVEQDKEMPHLVVDLTKALNALVEHYKLTKRQARA